MHPRRRFRPAAPSGARGRPSPRAGLVTGLVTGLVLVLVGAGLALLLTTAAPAPNALPGALQVAARTSPPATRPPVASRPRAPRPAATTTTPPTTTAPTTTSSTTTTSTTTTTLPPVVTVPGRNQGEHHRQKGDGGSTTVVAPAPSVQIEDNAGRRVGGDS